MAYVGDEMSERVTRDTPVKFSVRHGFGGTKVLIVRRYDLMKDFGTWEDAKARDLPAFFEYLQKGESK